MGAIGHFQTDGNVTKSDRGGDVAQSVEHRTVTPLRQVRFPGAARDFSPRGNFQCRLSYMCPYAPPVQTHALTSVRALKIL